MYVYVISTGIPSAKWTTSQNDDLYNMFKSDTQTIYIYPHDSSVQVYQVDIMDGDTNINNKFKSYLDR